MEKRGWIYANTKMIKTTKKVEYKASLKIVGIWTYSKGKTTLEAIENLKPLVIKGVGVLILEKGDKKQEKILSVLDMMGLWGELGPTHKTIALKRVMPRFDI